MTTKDAVQVARIMVHHSLSADKMIALFLMEFPEISWVKFFNATQAFIDTELHDKIFMRLER